MSAAASVNVRGAQDAFITGGKFWVRNINNATPLNQLFYSMIQPLDPNIFDRVRGQQTTQKMTTQLYRARCRQIRR